MLQFQAYLKLDFQKLFDLRGNRERKKKISQGYFSLSAEAPVCLNEDPLDC